MKHRNQDIAGDFLLIVRLRGADLWQKRPGRLAPKQARWVRIASRTVEIAVGQFRQTSRSPWVLPESPEHFSTVL